MKKRYELLLIVSLLVLLVTIPASATVPLQIGGSIFTEVRYTPEELWNGGSALALWSNLETEGGKINLNIIWSDKYGEGDFIWFSSNDKPDIPFSINSVTVTAEGLLLNSSWSNARVIMGDFGIDYSPWIGTLTPDHWRNNNLANGENHTRGIALEDLQLSPAGNAFTEPINLSAFHSWFGSEDEVFYGLKADTEINDFATALSFMRYHNRPITTNSDGYGEYGDSVDWENGLEFNVSGDLSDEVAMDFLSVYWSRMDETDSEKTISAPFNRLQVDWETPEIGVLDFEVYSFGKDFAPRFYEYDYDDDETSIIEDYLSRIGTGLKASILLSEDLIDEVYLSLGTDLHNLASDSIDLLYNESWIRADKYFGLNEANLKLAVKRAFEYDEGLIYHAYHNYNDILLHGRLLSRLVEEDNYYVSTRLLGQYSNAEESFVFDGNLKTELTDGLFKGLSAYLGIQKELMDDETDEEDELKTYAGLDYTTPSGIEITAKYAVEGTTEIEFDEFDDLEDKAETLFSIKKTVQF
jgi:hypothetical protein